MEASRLMPNIYYLGFKTGQAVQYLSNVLLSGSTTMDYQDNMGMPDDHAWTNNSTTTTYTSSSTLHDIWTAAANFPAVYSQWWWNLVKKDPIHVLVETTLILSILYILMARSKDWKETEEFLSKQEEEELLREWKLRGRASLTPNHDKSNANKSKRQHVVVHKVHGPFMDVTVSEDAGAGTNKNNKTKTATTSTAAKTHAMTTRANKKANKQQQQQQTDNNNAMTILNFATYDYLGMCSNQPSVRQAADQALNTYGCGSCGPRGFYGTIDAHLQLEQAFAEFLQVDGAILYSDGASTCASTIAAFAKRGDLIVADEGIYEPLRTGVSLSRAHVKYFKHNDMTDLRRLLQQIQAHDVKVGRPLNAQRRFLVVEGLYKNTGTIVPLQELVQLKHEFSYRLILDESNSFGTLGQTGRGVHELYNCPLMHDVEITTIALENSMGAIGGITVGSEEVVEHQRLSGSGYCFSASSPPFTASAAIQSLELLQNSTATTLQPLQDNVAYLHHKLTELCHVTLEDVLLVTSAPESPILFLQVADIPETRDLEELLFLREVVQECLLHGTTSTNSSSGSSGNHKKSTSSNNNNAMTSSMACVVESSPPGIRITVTASHTHEHLDHCLRIFSESVEVVLSRSH